ncbi:MAG: hypothetical protein JXM69_20200 [Anaerolineae bacterium]|nr:hypothetical protein [Anaerolineae bacterium]
MVSLVEQMLTLYQQLNQPQTPQAKTMRQRQIEATDQQIDKPGPAWGVVGDKPLPIDPCPGAAGHLVT